MEKQNLQDYLNNKMLMAEYKITKEEIANVPENLNLDELVKSRISQTLLLKYNNEVNKYISSKQEENGDMIYGTELVIMNNIELFELIKMLLSMPMRESTNLAVKMESIIEKEKQKYLDNLK